MRLGRVTSGRTTSTCEMSRSGSKAQPSALYKEAETFCFTHSLPITSKVNISAKNSHHLKNSQPTTEQRKNNQPSCLRTGWVQIRTPHTNKNSTHFNSSRPGLYRQDVSTPILDVKTCAAKK
ncbi:hypothetical protein FHG87_019305 [Trinorchestia longiramus]|nr:hypothetical protein FHG87_019305 [Trinorchestia longiramus]